MHRPSIGGGQLPARLRGLEDLAFQDTFTRELPGDPLTLVKDNPQDPTNSNRRASISPTQQQQYGKADPGRPGTGTGTGTSADESEASKIPTPQEVRGVRPVRGALFTHIEPEIRDWINAANTAPAVTPSTSSSATAGGKPQGTAAAATSSMYAHLFPPSYICHSPQACRLLDLNPDDHHRREFPLYLSGQRTLPRTRPWAHNYGGHQFGIYAGQLGDGRCISLGEIVNQRGERWELQLKGAGRTPYSRFGDGLAGLRSSLREFLASEYMAALGIPTTRALSVVATHLPVYRSDPDQPEVSAVLARLAGSWVRFGHFELVHYRNEKELVKRLADHVIKHHFAELLPKANVNAAVGAGTAAGSGNAKPAAHTAEEPSANHALRAPAANVILEADEEDAAASTEDSVSPNPNTDAQQNADSDSDYSDDEDEDDTLDDMSPMPARSGGGRRLSFIMQSFPVAPAPDSDSKPLSGATVESVQVDVKLNKYARFFQEVIRRTADLVAHWQSVGFVHGCLNTDNMSILGLTLDYGPFGFLDAYDPFCTINASDHASRYSFEQQPKIALWNLSKLGRTLAQLIVPPPASDNSSRSGKRPVYRVQTSLVGEHVVKGEEVVRELLKEFEGRFVETWAALMGKKLGLTTPLDTDLPTLINPLLELLSDTQADYTLFFRSLCSFPCDEAGFRAYIRRSAAGIDFDVDEEEDDENVGDCLSVLMRGVRRAKEGAKMEKGDTTVVMRASLAGANASRNTDETTNRRHPNTSTDSLASTSSGRASTSTYDEDDFPPVDEVVAAWRDWAGSYRARLLSQLPPGGDGSEDAVKRADETRHAAMRKVTPMYALRGYILDEVAEKVIAAVKPDPTNINPTPAQTSHPQQRVRSASISGSIPLSAAELGVGREVERCMRVLVGDVWGDVAEGKGGWKGEEDREVAGRWRGEPPLSAVNQRQTPAS